MASTRLFDKTKPDADSEIGLLELVVCLSDAMDFIDPVIISHHKRVSFIAYRIALEMGLPLSVQRDIALAGTLHDIGAFSLKERKDALVFEIEDPDIHAERGAALLKLFGPTSNIAPIVRFHHALWNETGASGSGTVPTASHILHLADRVAVLIDKDREVLSQVPSICERIREKKGSMFMPEAVDAFLHLASRECFWLDAMSPMVHSLLSVSMGDTAIDVNSETMAGFSNLFSRIIDFKSPFTVTHSSGVAASAELLAKLTGFTEKDCFSMRIAGHLHDLGKLAVPMEILDKPARLDKQEFNMIRHHAFYTHRLLETLAPLGLINKWASYHHEHLDGSGYPFHLKENDLPLGSQILAVADVFTAITEGRPYRAAMRADEAVNVLDDMVRGSALNRDIVATLKTHYTEIDKARLYAQTSATKDYESIRQTIER
jgi:HD-GYP domain-containing protein (c-di-GMP phosphodiesterase class II)